MPARKALKRILKILGKALLGLIVFLVLLLFLIHLTSVQRRIANRLSTFLSSKTKGRVEMDQLEFSLLGNLTIKGLRAWDPDSNQILSAGTIHVTSDIFDILSGDYLIGELRLEDVSGKLVQGKNGLNIKFFLDAFQSKNAKPKDTTATSITLRFNKVLLKNIDFEFLSEVSGTDIKVRFDSLAGNHAAFVTLGSTFSADTVLLAKPMISILTKTKPDTINTVVTTRNNNSFTPDFGIGLGFAFSKLNIADGNFSFNRDSVIQTTRFDPGHMALNDIQINLSEVRMHPDTLSGNAYQLAVQFPGLPLTLAGAGFQMNRQQVTLPGLQITSDTNTVSASLVAYYFPSAPIPEKMPNVVLSAAAIINPNDFSYFLTDATMNYFKQWKTTELAIDGSYISGEGDLKKLNIKTSNSELTAKGKIKDLQNLATISWQDMDLNASVGADFKSTMAPFIAKIKVPPSVRLQMNSSGNPKRMFVDGNVKSTWGDAKAKGTIVLLPQDIDLDMKVSGERVQLSQWTGQTWMGPVSMTADAKGKIGAHQDALINGEITSIVLMNHPIDLITFQSRIQNQNISADIKIDDPRYRLQGHTDFSYAQPLVFKNEFRFDTFQLGRLVTIDSTLLLTGNLAADITIDASTIEGKANGKDFAIINHYSNYTLDTFSLDALLSPTASRFDYMTHVGNGNLIANFDLKELPGLLQPWIKNILNPSSNVSLASGNRSLQFDVQLNEVAPLQLLGIDVQEFSGIHAAGDLDEQNHNADIHINTGKFKGYGVSLDTLYGDLSLANDSIGGNVNGRKIFYDTYDLGNLDFNVSTSGDTTLADLEMSRDSASYLALGTKILAMNGGAYLYPYKFRAFSKDYHFDPGNPIFLNDSNVVLKNFNINYDSMQLSLNGDVHAFDAVFKRLDLTEFNPLISKDTNVINKGYLNGTFTYATGQKLDFKANIDSLILYNSDPLIITLTAKKDNDQLPFTFLLVNETPSTSMSANNNLDFRGKYFLNDKTVDAALSMNINQPEIFAFLYKDILSKIKGTIKGQATVTGPVQKPNILGHVNFKDFTFTTTQPILTFNIPDDSIRLDNTGVTLDHFTLYDTEHHPLTISGNLNTSNLPAYQYEFNVNADDYALINNPDTLKGPLKGLLVLDCDLDLKGNEKDKSVKADVDVKSNTNLIFTMASKEDVLLNTIGVIEFVDPGQLVDSTKTASPESMYDSIVSSLPHFNLNAKIKVDENAKLKVITDPQSGDFFEASGGANLELEFDRTGNAHIAGNYTIKEGLYRISFYDLVKKTFTLVPGSYISWSGSPESGELDIRATYNVATNSIGLIGNEIGENEKSIYKRTLEYIIGINIKGTLNKPIISFTLDLPQEDKTSYPVLANKLDRLRLPEFQSELNKQVFGLLVLGGFMPETSMADVDQAQVATTAIYNSVNAILASQLNRFASQYVKGVNIDVGIQSYADYSTPGGKTQTAMDFRVSKSILNDRLSFEVGGEFNLRTDQSGSNTGNNYHGDVAIIYDLTGNGDKQLKLFNNESYDIIYQEIRNTGISLIFIREFNKGDKKAEKKSPLGDLGAEKAEKKKKAEKAEKKKEK
jgi:hypothetical protein